MTRRLALATSATVWVAAAQEAAMKPRVPDRGPQIAGELVKEFVGAGHNNIEKVKELLGRQASLVRVAWDWGGGDFESALGGAGHMGQREIAEFLIRQGAPLELPAAAMLGKLDYVKATIAAFPGIEKTLGPHKIPLLAHAKRGGTVAEGVVKYLESLG